MRTSQGTLGFDHTHRQSVACCRIRPARGAVNTRTSMTETTEKNSTDRESLKISLTPKQKLKLGKVAQEHHNGNKSALVRSAVYLYERVMEKPDDLPAPTQIKATLEDLQGEVQDLDSAIESLPEQMKYTPHADSGGTHVEEVERVDEESNGSSPNPNRDVATSTITSKLHESAPGSCSIDELSDTAALPESELLPVLNELVSDGIIAEQTSEEKGTRYSLETDDSFGVAL